MRVIIGGRGRLGTCLANHSDEPVHVVDRAIYAEWWREDGAQDVLTYFKKHQISQGTIFIAAGLLDPSKPVLEHEQANYLLPKHVIEGVSSLGMRVITFGTVMEGLIGDKTGNPYVMSKLKLSEFIQRFADNNNLVLHVRLHTLYGGAAPPHEFMFLGQLLNAIHNRANFQMTSGEQLREYHHVNDVALAVSYLAQTPLTGVTHLSHGRPEKLKDIAHYVLESFGYRPLLHLNALSQPSHENYDAFFTPQVYGKHLDFRETLLGIVDYLKPFVAESRHESSIAV